MTLHQETNPAGQARITVRVYFMGIPVGFYRARRITHQGLFLEHGPIVFPEGRNITVEFFDRLGAPRFCLDAIVQTKDEHGMQLSFDYSAIKRRSSDHWVVEWEMPPESEQRNYLKG